MSDWIPVSEKLPEAGQYVLFHGRGITDMGWWQFGRWKGAIMSVGHDAVTHWMPLPAPPEVELDYAGCQLPPGIHRDE